MKSEVPSSISFGKKIIEIPNLKEVGIPPEISGLGFVSLEKSFRDSRYSGGVWVNKGDTLLSYIFNAFSKDSSNFLERLSGNHATYSETWEIKSPVSGLILYNRREWTSEYNPHTNLLYHNVDHPSLPVILIPEDEPLPNENNFYEYNRLASWLAYSFYRLPIRNPEDISPKRLRDHMTKFPDTYEGYNKYLEDLSQRNSDDYKSYSIREIQKEDYELLSNVQALRSKYLDLRDKLVHISKEFNESL